MIPAKSTKRVEEEDDDKMILQDYKFKRKPIQKTDKFQPIKQIDSNLKQTSQQNYDTPYKLHSIPHFVKQENLLNNKTGLNQTPTFSSSSNKESQSLENDLLTRLNIFIPALKQYPFQQYDKDKSKFQNTDKERSQVQNDQTDQKKKFAYKNSGGFQQQKRYQQNQRYRGQENQIDCLRKQDTQQQQISKRVSKFSDDNSLLSQTQKAQRCAHRIPFGENKAYTNQNEIKMPTKKEDILKDSPPLQLQNSLKDTTKSERNDAEQTLANIQLKLKEFDQKIRSSEQEVILLNQNPQKESQNMILKQLMEENNIKKILNYCFVYSNLKFLTREAFLKVRDLYKKSKRKSLLPEQLIISEKMIVFHHGEGKKIPSLFTQRHPFKNVYADPRIKKRE